MVTVPLSSLTYNHIGDPRRWSFRPRTRFRQRILFLSAPRLRLHGSTPHCTPHDFRTFSSCMLEQHLQGGSLVGALLRNLRLVLIDPHRRHSYAPLRLITAQLRPSSAHRWHAASPHVGLSLAQPLRLNSAQARLGSPRHSSPHLGPASPRLLNGSRSPGLPRRFSSTGHVPIPSDKAAVQLHGLGLRTLLTHAAPTRITAADRHRFPPSVVNAHLSTVYCPPCHATSPRQTLTLALQPLYTQSGIHIRFFNSLDFLDGSTGTPVARRQGVSNADCFAMNSHRTHTHTDAQLLAACTPPSLHRSPCSLGGSIVVDIFRPLYVLYLTALYLINCTFTRMRTTIDHVCPLSTCLVLSPAGYDIRLTNGYGSLVPSNPHITIDLGALIQATADLMRL